MRRLEDALMIAGLFVFLCLGWVWEKLTGEDLMGE